MTWKKVATCKNCGETKTIAAHGLCWGCYKHQRQLSAKYGITQEEYEAMLSNQGHVCWICKEKGKRRLTIDHDHETGKIRGLLCCNCNFGLGFFNDDPGLLRRAAQYCRGEL